MASAIKIQNTKIQDIFKNMDYGEITENIDAATSWLKSIDNQIFTYTDDKAKTPVGNPIEIKNIYNGDMVLCQVYVPDTKTIHDVLTKSAECKTKWIDTSAIDRAKLMQKFAEEIQKNLDCFCQIDVYVRGILRKDTTEKGVPLLIDCLRFYSGFAVAYGLENPAWKPQGVSVGIFSDSSPLCLLGYFLGPALAAGYNIIIQAAPKISVSIAFLIKLSITAGIPKGVIRLIPGNVEIQEFFINKHVSVVAIFDDLYKDEYRNVTSPYINKKLITLSSTSRVPMIIFDDADLDSACHAVINAAWGYRSMLPWSVRNILVQENVFNVVKEKINGQIRAAKIGHGNDIQVDITYPYDADDTIKTQVVLIEGKIHMNNVIKADTHEVTLTAFRTVNEAVVLANNSRYGLAATVWTENLSLANEVARKLKVGHVWINSHGLFSADIPLSPYKSSGNSFFGGKEGFYEYVEIAKFLNTSIVSTKTSTKKTFLDAWSVTKKAQESWTKLSRFARTQKLNDLAQFIISNKTVFINAGDTSSQEIDDWIQTIYAITVEQGSGTTSCYTTSTSINYNVSSFAEPNGPVIIEYGHDSDCRKLIVSALVEGNAVIMLNGLFSKFYAHLTKFLPANLFVQLIYSIDLVQTLASHREVKCYFARYGCSVLGRMPLKDMSKVNVGCGRNSSRKIAHIKTVWSNVGQSFL